MQSDFNEKEDILMFTCYVWKLDAQMINKSSWNLFAQHWNYWLHDAASLNGGNNCLAVKAVKAIDTWYSGKYNAELNPPWRQGSWGQHWTHLGTTGPRSAPCWPPWTLLSGQLQDTTTSHYSRDFLGSNINVNINSFCPGQNGRLFADDIFKCIFMNEKFLYFDSNFIEICS